MNSNERQLRDRLAVGVAGLVALLVAVMVLHQAAIADFLYQATQLSDATAACEAIEPRGDRNAAGTWMGVVWIQYGKDDQDLCKVGGSAMLRAATTGAALQDWSAPVSVYDGSPVSPQGCAIHADVAIQGNTAHVAVAVRNPCLWDKDAHQVSTIVYRTCDLSTSMNCSDMQTAVSLNTGSDERRITDVRVAVDGQARPHLAYATVDNRGMAGEIWYHRNLDGTWGSEAPSKVSAPVTGSYTGDAAYRPHIAWGAYPGEGRVHIVWETHVDEITDFPQFLDGDVRYRYCGDTVGTCQPVQKLGNGQGVGVNFEGTRTHPNPELDVKDGYVAVVWNHCQDIDWDPPCEAFGLQYRRSTDGGASFSAAREVGTDLTVLGTAGYKITTYPGTDFFLQSGELMEYDRFTRPSIALDDDGYPYVAWQVYDSDIVGITPYFIATAYATDTIGTDGLVWSSHHWTVRESPSFKYLTPVILSLTSAPAEAELHLFYVRDDGTHPLQVYYNFLGEGAIGPDPTPTGDGDEENANYLFVPLLHGGER